ncbi:MAG: hypothetical protein RL704_83, partial [Pseudomonadota bacterium]
DVLQEAFTEFLSMKKKNVLANKAIDINQNVIPVISLDCRRVVFINPLFVYLSGAKIE